jgi:hypothetical protein
MTKSPLVARVGCPRTLSAARLSGVRASLPRKRTAAGRITLCASGLSFPPLVALTGYKDVEAMQKNPDLKWLREVVRPQFGQIVKTVPK